MLSQTDSRINGHFSTVNNYKNSFYTSDRKSNNNVLKGAVVITWSLFILVDQIQYHTLSRINYFVTK